MTSLRISRFPLLFMLAGGALACDDVELGEYTSHTGIITGTVLYQAAPATPATELCTPKPARGNVIVTLFQIDRLPPPTGSSGPLNVIIVPEAKLFDPSSAREDGIFATDFTMPTVPAGDYQIRAFLDADGDFNPAVDLLAQPTAGDVGGGHVDPVTRAFQTIHVENDRITSQVTVSVGLDIPVERPAFAITTTTTFTVPFRLPQTMVIESHPIQRPQVTMKPGCTRFLVQYVDVNGDGIPDDSNGDNLPDVYPTVIFRRVPTPDNPNTILAAGIVNPFPYMDALAAFPAVPTDMLELIIPPVALERSAEGERRLNGIPAGDYDMIVISGTGQTWQIPNQLDRIQLGETDPTQSVRVKFVDGAPLPSGSISGTVQLTAEASADAYVFAFPAANPPPPLGSGRPLALATVPAASFQPAGAVREASFTISGLPDGPYILLGLHDVDDSFSPLVDLIAQPSAGDYGGGAAMPATVQGGANTPGVTVRIGTLVPFDRPAFEIDDVRLQRTAFPAAIELRAHAIDRLGITEDSARVPVSLFGVDLDGDNFEDLLPRVLLTKMLDEGDPRTARDDPAGIIIPGIVDPIPFLATLAGGAPAVPTGRLRVILPPVALRRDASGALLPFASPPPDGRYRVNLLSSTGQTWSVPSNLDVVLGRLGTPRADPTQGRFVSVEATPIPGGSITGALQLTVPKPAEDFTVVVFAFSSTNPPPPLGGGRPRAVALVPASAFDEGGLGAYRLAGLNTGTYEVRAFLDTDDDFTAWFDTMNQPDAGDVGGGHLDQMGRLLPVDVDALRGATENVNVAIIAPATYTTDRPVFTVSGPAVLRIATGSTAVTLQALARVRTPLLNADGVFPIRWVDLDGDGRADDRTRDGIPDLFPIVVADLLDPDDETNQRLHPDGIRIPGILSPLQFVPLGFPAGDPTAVTQTVVTGQVQVIFPAVAVAAAAPTTPIVPPAGRYRITAVNPRGQTWSVPNELQRAVGTELQASQSVYLTVE